MEETSLSTSGKVKGQSQGSVMWAGGGGGQGTSCNVNKQTREGIGSSISAMIRMRERLNHAVGWENAAQVERGTGAKAWRGHLCVSFKNQQGKGGGWYRVRGGGKEVAGGELAEVTLGDHAPYKALWVAVMTLNWEIKWIPPNHTHLFFLKDSWFTTLC